MGIDEEAHGGSAGEEHRVIGLVGGVGEASLDVGGLEVGKILKDFGMGDAGGKKVEHVLDADAHSANARAASALGGIEGDAVVHGDEDS